VVALEATTVVKSLAMLVFTDLTIFHDGAGVAAAAALRGTALAAQAPTAASTPSPAVAMSPVATRRRKACLPDITFLLYPVSTAFSLTLGGLAGRQIRHC
jgi:hypothetical protein